MRAIGQYQYSFMQWREILIGETISIIVSVCQNYNNWVVQEGVMGASTKTCPEHERCATGFSTIFIHIVNVHWMLNLKSCTIYEVVSLPFEKSSLADLILGTLRLHMKNLKIFLALHYFSCW